MVNNFEIHPINPVKFYQQSDILNTGAYPFAAYNGFNPNFNDRGIDNDFFHRNLKSWMTKCKYYQPYQHGDPITLQWLGVDDAPGPIVLYKANLITPSGQIVKQQDGIVGAEVGSGSGVYLREVSMILHDVPEGYYHVQLYKLATPLSSESDFFCISEGIHVKAHHPDTSLFKYSHTENAYGIIWETGIEMQIRLHAAFTELTPASKFQVYEDQPANLTLLSGTMHREWLLSFGINSNYLPDYLYDQIERIMLCDTIYKDGVLITRTEGSKLEIGRVDKYPLSSASITVRERNNSNELIVPPFEPIVMGTASDSEWFYVTTITQASPATTYVIGDKFNGAQNFVAWLNGSGFAGADGINTRFAINSRNEIVMITNDQDVYDDYSPGLTIDTILEGHLLARIKAQTGATDIQVDFTNTAVTTKYAYFWGDLSAKVTGFGTSASKTHTYAAGTETTAYLFWDKVHNLSLGDSDLIIHSLFGKLPDLTITFNCENNLLKKIENNIFSNMGGNCTAIQLSGNKLTSYAINDIIRFAYEAKDGNFSGASAIDMQSQTPTVGPSADPGIFYFKTECQTAGITIQHD